MGMMPDNAYYSKGTQLIIKPTSACNFDCTFCSAKKLDIPMHDKVPDVLREYILDMKPRQVIITGGEPLINPMSYFEDLINILDSIDHDYHISMTSNLVLWYENPEKYDWLLKHPRVDVDTSFQYGDGRKDDQVYTEERFKALFYAFEARYGKKLSFISVINKDNEKFALKTCELAKELGTLCKLNSQIPVGLATEYYPRYKLLGIYLDIIKAGLRDYESNLDSLEEHFCAFTRTYKHCLLNKAVYVNQEGKLVEDHCEEVIASEGKLKIENGSLFPKCYYCDLFSMCNACSINRQCSEEVKHEHCEWMMSHKQELQLYGLIDYYDEA